MDQLLSGVSISALAPWPLILLGFLLFMRGDIRPNRAIQEVRADRDARLAEKDQQIADWREAYRLESAARSVSDATSREALEVARAAEDALKGFRVATTQAAAENRSARG